MHPSVFFAPESWILRQTLTHTRVRIFSNNLHKAIRHPRDGQGLLGLAQRKPAWVNFAAPLTLLNKCGYIVNSTLSSMETSSPPRAINMHADRYHFPQRACRIIECGKMPTRSAGGGRAQGLLGFTILRSPHFFFFFFCRAKIKSRPDTGGKTLLSSFIGNTYVSWGDELFSGQTVAEISPRPYRLSPPLPTTKQTKTCGHQLGILSFLLLFFFVVLSTGNYHQHRSPRLSQPPSMNPMQRHNCNKPAAVSRSVQS